MGFLAERRARKAAEEALAHYQRRLNVWTEDERDLRELVELASTFRGTPESGDVLLQPGENLYLMVEGASLVEDRTERGHWEGRSAGTSVRVAKGVRVHVGKSRGTFVQATPHPTAVDTGRFFVTDRRATFAGARQTRECLFAKLNSYDVEPGGILSLSVSNRQKTTRVHVGELAFALPRLEIALRVFRGTIDQFVREAEATLLAKIEAKPVPPPPPLPPASPS